MQVRPEFTRCIKGDQGVDDRQVDRQGWGGGGGGIAAGMVRRQDWTDGNWVLGQMTRKESVTVMSVHA